MRAAHSLLAAAELLLSLVFFPLFCGLEVLRFVPVLALQALFLVVLAECGLLPSTLANLPRSPVFVFVFLLLFGLFPVAISFPWRSAFQEYT